ncbi:hypothetical protein GCM10022209_50960 [Chitinophaga oryziterrae]
MAKITGPTDMERNNPNTSPATIAAVMRYKIPGIDNHPKIKGNLIAEVTPLFILKSLKNV